MTQFLLIRHGTTDMVGCAIAGRTPGVHLNAEGQRQVAQLAERLASVPLDAIYASPLERTRETAASIAGAHRLEVQTLEAIGEVDFGEWTGCAITSLSGDWRWQQFNLFRSGTRIPGGELMVDVQQRAVAAIEALRERHPNGRVAVVTHADVIRVVLAYYAGIPLDLFLRIGIDPASVSVLAVHDYGPQIRCINDLGSLSSLVL